MGFGRFLSSREEEGREEVDGLRILGGFGDVCG